MSFPRSHGRGGRWGELDGVFCIFHVTETLIEKVVTKWSPSPTTYTCHPPDHMDEEDEFLVAGEEEQELQIWCWCNFLDLRLSLLWRGFSVDLKVKIKRYFLKQAGDKKMKLARRLRSGKYTLQHSWSDYQHTKIIFPTFDPCLPFSNLDYCTHSKSGFPGCPHCANNFEFSTEI